jgi:hypothetical protein
MAVLATLAVERTAQGALATFADMVPVAFPAPEQTGLRLPSQQAIALSRRDLNTVHDVS